LSFLQYAIQENFSSLRLYAKAMHRQASWHRGSAAWPRYR